MIVMDFSPVSSSPIWHNLSKDEVAKHASSMVGRLALHTSFLSADEIVAELEILRDRYRENESTDQ